MPDGISIDVFANTSPMLSKISADIAKIPPIRIQYDGGLGRITGDANAFSRSLEAATARVSAFSLAAGSFYLVSRSIKDTIAVTMDLQKAFAQINAIAGLSSSGLVKFGNDLIGVANQTGQSWRIASEAALQFTRQGLGIEQTLQRTKDALTLVRIGGLDYADAIRTLTTALNAYNNTLLTSTKITNSLLTVDTQFPVAGKDIADALTRVSSIAKDAGVNFDKLVGMVTAVKTITGREGSVIGTALGTIFQRIERPQVLNQLQQLGVKVKDASGAALSADTILQNLAKTYTGLSQAQQNQLAMMSGGVRQGNIFRALMADLANANSIYARATDVSSKSTDLANKRQAELNKTLSAQLNSTINNVANAASQGGSLAFTPVLERLLGSANTVSNAVSGALGSNQNSTIGEQIGGTIGKGLLKGLGDFLQGPAIALIGTILVKFGSTFTGYLGKAFSSVIETSSKQFQINQELNKVLSENIGLQKQIANGELTQLEIEQKILAIIQQQNIAKTQFQAVGIGVGNLIGSGKLNFSQNQFSLPSRAGGHIPEMEEMMGAYNGGYTPGKIKKMNVSGIGTVIYNDAETVKKFPGMKQPAILPPPNSKAGYDYEKAFHLLYGYNPYGASGKIPHSTSNFPKGASFPHGATNQGEIINVKKGSFKIPRVHNLVGVSGRYAEGLIPAAGGLISNAGQKLAPIFESQAEEEFNKLKDSLRNQTATYTQVTKSAQIMAQRLQLTDESLATMNRSFNAINASSFLSGKQNLFNNENFALVKVPESISDVGLHILPTSGKTFQLPSSSPISDPSRLLGYNAPLQIPQFSQSTLADVSRMVVNSSSEKRIQEFLKNNQSSYQSPFLEPNSIEKRRVLTPPSVDYRQDAIRAQANSFRYTDFGGRSYRTGSGLFAGEDLTTQKSTDDEQKRQLQLQKRKSELITQNNLKLQQGVELQNKENLILQAESDARKVTSLSSYKNPLNWASNLSLRSQLLNDETGIGGAALQKAKQQYAGRAFGISFAAPLIAGVAQEAIGSDTLGQRRAGAAVGGAGDIASFAAMGTLLEPGIGTAIGGAIGGIVAIQKVFTSWNDVLPDLQRHLEQVKDSSERSTESLSNYLDSANKLNDIYSGSTTANVGQVNQLQTQEKSSLLGISDNNLRQTFENLIKNNKIDQANELAANVKIQNEQSIKLATSSLNLPTELKNNQRIISARNNPFQQNGDYQQYLGSILYRGGQAPQNDLRFLKLPQTNLNSNPLFNTSPVINQIGSEVSQNILGLTNINKSGNVQSLYDEINKNISQFGNFKNIKDFENTILDIGNKSGFAQDQLNEIRKQLDDLGNSQGAKSFLEYLNKTFSPSGFKEASDTLQTWSNGAKKSTQDLINSGDLLQSKLEDLQNNFENLGDTLSRNKNTDLSQLALENVKKSVAQRATDVQQMLAVGTRPNKELVQSQLSFNESKLNISNQYQTDLVSAVDDLKIDLNKALKYQATNLISKYGDLISKQGPSNIASVQKGSTLYNNNVLGFTSKLPSINENFQPQQFPSLIKSLQTLQNDQSLPSGLNKTIGQEINKLNKVYQAYKDSLSKADLDQQVKLIDLTGKLQEEQLVYLKQIKDMYQLSAGRNQGISTIIGNKVIEGGSLNGTDISASFFSSWKQTSADFWTDTQRNLQEFGASFKKDFVDGFAEAEKGAHSFHEVLSNITLEIAQSATKNFASTGLGAILNLGSQALGGNSAIGKVLGTSSGGSIFSSVLGSLFGHANGGLIKGYSGGGSVNMGSGNKDDVPAMLSGGEYVIKKSAVNKIGKHNLDRMNGGMINGYADGGSISGYPIDSISTSQIFGLLTSAGDSTNKALDETQKIRDKYEDSSQPLSDNLISSLINNKSVQSYGLDLSKYISQLATGGLIKGYSYGGITKPYVPQNILHPTSFDGSSLGISAGITPFTTETNSANSLFGSVPTFGAQDGVDTSLNNSFDFINGNTGGYRNTSSLLSSVGQNSALNPQNKLILSQEQWLTGYKKYLQNNESVMSQFKTQQDLQLGMSYLGSVGNILGAIGGASAQTQANNNFNVDTSGGAAPFSPTNNPVFNASQSANLMDAFEFDPNSPFSLGQAKGGLIRGYASGGRVFGGNSSTDNIPAMLMGGEYVMKKNVVNKYGSGFFDSLNNGNKPKGFAAGGLVGGNSAYSQDNEGDDASNYLSKIVDLLTENNKNSSKTSNGATSSSVTPNVPISINLNMPNNNSTTVSNNISSNTTSTNNNKKTFSQDDAKQLSSMIKAQVLDIINRESRQGGVLYEKFN